MVQAETKRTVRHSHSLQPWYNTFTETHDDCAFLSVISDTSGIWLVTDQRWTSEKSRKLRARQ